MIRSRWHDASWTVRIALIYAGAYGLIKALQLVVDAGVVVHGGLPATPVGFVAAGLTCPALFGTLWVADALARPDAGTAAEAVAFVLNLGLLLACGWSIGFIRRHELITLETHGRPE